MMKNAVVTKSISRKSLKAGVSIFEAILEVLGIEVRGEAKNKEDAVLAALAAARALLAPPVKHPKAKAD